MNFCFPPQKLRQELLSRQGSVEATRDSVSKLLRSSDASTASGLQGALDELTRRYTAAQGSQAECEAELRGLLPKLESYERLATDLQAFAQTRLKALSPAGQPDRSMDDYRQTIEVSGRVSELPVCGSVASLSCIQHVGPISPQEVRSELEQEAGQLKSFSNLGTELSHSQALGNAQSLLDKVRGVSDEFSQLEANVNKRYEYLHTRSRHLCYKKHYIKIID